MPTSFWFFIVAMGVSLPLAACGRSEPSRASAARPESSTRAAPGDGTAAGSPGAPDLDRASKPGARERKLVRSAALQLEVEEYPTARGAVDAALARAGGHVARARVEHADGMVALASLELRVPAAALDEFVREAAGFGTVLHEEMRTDEISEEYYDAQARLGNAQKLEQRLLEFAGAKTSDVKGLLEVERELGRVREEIETLAGRIAGYDGQVALSALSLEMVSRQRVSVGDAPGLGARLQHAWRESSGALLRTGRGALVLLTFLLPWLPVLAAAAFLAGRMLRVGRSKCR
jgi:hypothetical protein